ncbi:non-ribosomal peptide synthetase [Streptomyces sp. NPDC004031]
MRSLLEAPGLGPVPPAGSDGPDTRLVPQGILARAALHPERVAVVYGDTQLTYRELVTRAGELAGRLRAAGAVRESTVALCLPRTPDLVVAILAVWFAGAACLMTDPVAPPRRREHMLRDSRTELAVTTPELAAHFPAGIRVLLPTPDTQPAQTAQTAPRPQVATRPDDLAYVIYTSGTTGRPKGVLVEHHALAALADSMEKALYRDAVPDVERVALNGGTSADPFFADFVNLTRGRTLVVVDEDTRRDPERLAELLVHRRVDLLDGTPTQIRALLLAAGPTALAGVRVLVLGSEPTDAELWKQLRALPGTRAHNYYGPTETTIYCTGAVVAEHPEPVIGTALPGNGIVILDEELRPVPDGQVGEIWVTGAQLARGYLNAGPAEQARFTDLRLPGRAAPVRAYRTGDRGRFDAAGQVEFLGRFDSQVSVNGYRVELGEIEAALRSCPGVGNAAVALVKDGGQGTLAAWVLLTPATRADPAGSLDRIRARLAESLPAHMLPRMRAVPAVPMNIAGKADVQALTASNPPLTGPAAPEPGAGGDPAAPEPGQDLAALLRGHWTRTLRIDTVAPDDSFFALGGDSLMATELIVAVRERFAAAIPIRTIFDHPRFTDFQQAVAERVGTAADRAAAARV